MAKIFISEHVEPELVSDQQFAAVNQPPLAEQTLTTSGSSGQTSAFNARTRIIRVHTDGICSISIGANPTATTSTGRMAAGQTEYFRVEGAHKLAGITNT